MSTSRLYRIGRHAAGLTIVACVIAACGCGSEEKVQMPDNPTPPPGPSSVLKPLDNADAGGK